MGVSQSVAKANRERKLGVLHRRNAETVEPTRDILRISEASAPRGE